MNKRIRWGAKKVDESKVKDLIENRVKLIRVKVYYKHGLPNEGEYSDYRSAIQALTAFTEL